MSTLDPEATVAVSFEVPHSRLDEFHNCWTEFQTGQRFDHYLQLRSQDLQKCADSLRKMVDFVTRTGFSTGGAHVMAGLLGSLYNGDRVRWDASGLTRLDYAWAEHCFNVQRLHTYGGCEVHSYFEDGGRIWEQMIKDYGLEKRRRTR